MNSASFDLTINGDTAVESDETIIISAVLAAYPTSTASKTITVTNDDAAQALPGATPTTAAAMGLTPTVQYHPNSQSGSATKSNGKVIASPDLMGLAAFAQPTAAVAPSERTDGSGLKCWRFDDAAWGSSGNEINAIDTRAIAIFLVVRCHNSNGTKFAAINYQSDGASGTAAAGSLSTATGTVAPYIGGSAVTQSDANFPHMVPGTRKQVIGMVSRTTANGGQRMYRNLVACPGAQQSSGYTNAMGLLFGATRASSGGALTGNLNGYDLYEAVIVKGVLTNAQADQIANALVNNHSIAAITSMVTDDGDSITESVGDAPSGSNATMAMTEPGANLMPESVQVVNLGISGSTTVSLTSKRDASPSMFGTMVISPANDVVIVQIGRNNYGALGQTAQQTYDALKALIWGDANSYLARGRKVIVCINICSGNNVTIQQIRNLVLGNLITDCQAGPGGLYENKLRLRRLDLISVGGQTVFEDAADASNLTYMQNDGTHPSILGNLVMGTGGDTPQHGKAAAF